MVRPRSCWVICYFDTPTLEKRYQLFDRIIIDYELNSNMLMNLAQFNI